MVAQANRESEAPPSQAVSTAAPASFTALEKSLPGQVGIAYSAPGSTAVQSIGDLQSGSAWSTSKVPVAARVIKDAHGAGSLSSSQRSLISSAITASDNAAAMQLWDELVSRYGGAAGAAQAVTEVLAAAGDTGTTVSSVGRGSFSPYGQTEWSLAGQARFMASLAGGCVPGSSYLLARCPRSFPASAGAWARPEAMLSRAAGARALMVVTWSGRWALCRRAAGQLSWPSLPFLTTASSAPGQRYSVA